MHAGYYEWKINYTWPYITRFTILPKCGITKQTSLALLQMQYESQGNEVSKQWASLCSVQKNTLKEVAKSVQNNINQ